MPFRRKGREAVSVGRDTRRRIHFMNRCFEVIRFALEERLVKQWSSEETAAKD